LRRLILMEPAPILQQFGPVKTSPLDDQRQWAGRAERRPWEDDEWW
jgi:hypothetical protein